MTPTIQELQAWGALPRHTNTLRDALERISKHCPPYTGDYTMTSTPSDYGNPEDYAREQQAMLDARIGDIARAALKAQAAWKPEKEQQRATVAGLLDLIDGYSPHMPRPVSTDIRAYTEQLASVGTNLSEAAPDEAEESNRGAM